MPENRFEDLIPTATLDRPIRKDQVEGNLFEDLIPKSRTSKVPSEGLFSDLIPKEKSSKYDALLGGSEAKIGARPGLKISDIFGGTRSAVRSLLPPVTPKLQEEFINRALQNKPVVGSPFDPIMAGAQDVARVAFSPVSVSTEAIDRQLIGKDAPSLRRQFQDAIEGYPEDDTIGKKVGRMLKETALFFLAPQIAPRTVKTFTEIPAVQRRQLTSELARIEAGVQRLYAMGKESEARALAGEGARFVGRALELGKKGRSLALRSARLSSIEVNQPPYKPPLGLPSPTSPSQPIKPPIPGEVRTPAAPPALFSSQEAAQKAMSYFQSVAPQFDYEVVPTQSGSELRSFKREVKAGTEIPGIGKIPEAPAIQAVIPKQERPAGPGKIPVQRLPTTLPALEPAAAEGPAPIKSITVPSAQVQEFKAIGIKLGFDVKVSPVGRRQVKVDYYKKKELPPAPVQPEELPAKEALTPEQKERIITALGGPNAKTKYGFVGNLSDTDLFRLVEARIKPAKVKTEKAPPKTLIGAIRRRGGIDPGKLAKDYKLDEDVKQAGLIGILRKGGVGLDEMAASLQESGDLLVPEGQNADDYLMQVLQDKNRRIIRAEQDVEAQMEKEALEYYKEKAIAEKAGIPESDIVAAEREGEELGKIEGKAEIAQEFPDEVGDAWEPTETQAEIPGTQAQLPDRPLPPKDLIQEDPGGLFEVKEPGPEKFHEKAPAFFSQVERSIQEKMPAAAGPEQVRGILKGAVKQEEVDWLDVEGFLEGKEKVSKQELLDYIRANNVNIQEVVHGERTGLVRAQKEPGGYWTAWVGDEQIGQAFGSRSQAMEAAKSDTGTNKFSAYQLPGGENYREVLLTLPAQTPRTWKFDVDTMADIQAERAGQQFRSPHFDEPNIIAHVRMNDRVDADGKKVLFIEEVQSDWHRIGRKEGYRQPALSEKETEELLKLEANRKNLTPEKAIRYANLSSRNFASLQGVPDAPFKKTWHELVLKRMLRYAAENGYDKVAWTTGEQQADRYDLSKKAERVVWDPKSHALLVRGMDGKAIIDQITEPEKLESILGKEIAKKLIEGKPMRGSSSVVLTGTDLKFGGEGMKGFYDQIIPAYLNKYTKKWGGRVGTATIETPEYINVDIVDQNGNKLPSDKSTVHSLDITPAMKQSVLFEGQAVFERGKLYPGGKDDHAATPIPEDLLSIQSVKEGASPLSKGPGPINRLSLRSRFEKTGSLHLPKQQISSPADVAFLFNELTNKAQENFYVLAMKGTRPIGIAHTGIGTVDAAMVDPSIALILPMTRKATSVYIVHNHPSGDPKPSREDLDLTQRIAKAMNLAGIKLNAHIVIEGGRFAHITPDGFSSIKNVPTLESGPRKVSIFGGRKLIRKGEGQPFSGELTAIADAAAYVKRNVQPENVKLSVIAMDIRNRVLGQFPFTERLPLQDLQREILRRAILVNSKTLIVAGTDEGMIQDVKVLENQMRVSANVAIMDIFRLQKGKEPSSLQLLGEFRAGRRGTPEGVGEEKPSSEESGIVKSLRQSDLKQAEFRIARELYEKAKVMQETGRSLIESMRSEGGHSEEDLSKLALSVGSMKRLTIKEFLPEAKRIVQEQAKELAKGEVLSKPQIKNVRASIRKIGRQLRREQTSELGKATAILNAAHVGKLTPSQLMMYAKAFLGKKAGDPISGREVSELAQAITKTRMDRETGEFKQESRFIPREPQISGAPPRIPRSRVLTTVGPEPKRDLSRSSTMAISELDPIRAAEVLDGEPGGYFYRTLVEPIANSSDTAEAASQRLYATIEKVAAGIKPASKESARVQDLAERHIPFERATDQERRLEAEGRRTYNDLLSSNNEALKSLGRPTIKPLDNYATHFIEMSFLDSVFGGLENIPRAAAKGNYSLNPQVGTPYFVYKRLGGNYTRDYLGGLARYIQTSMRLQHVGRAVKVASAELEKLAPGYQGKEGYPNAYKYFKQFLSDAAGKPTVLDSALNVPYELQKFMDGAQKLSNMGLILGNLSTALVQFSSTGAGIAENGLFWQMRGQARMMRPEAWDFVLTHSPELRNRVRFGTLLYKPGRPSRMANYLLELFDQYQFSSSWMARFEKEIKRNLDFERAARLAEIAAIKTNATMRKSLKSPLMRQRVLGVLTQLQTFVVNQRQQLFTDPVLRGRNRGAMAGWWYLGVLIATNVAINEFYYRMKGRGSIDWTDFIPFPLSIYAKAKESKGRFVPAILQLPGIGFDAIETLKEKKSLSSLAPAFMRAVMMYIPVGNQMYKTATGAQAVNRGGVFTPSGKLRYPVYGPGDTFQALTQGPSSTRGAREWRERGFTPETYESLDERIRKSRDPAERQQLRRLRRQQERNNQRQAQERARKKKEKEGEQNRLADEYSGQTNRFEDLIPAGR